MKKLMINKVVKFDIVNACSEAIVYKLNTHLNKNGLEYEKLKLGVNVIVLNVSKLAIILILSIYYNTFWETVVMIMANSFIRHNAFGLHAKNPTVCLISTTLMFVLPPILLKSAYLSNYMIVVIFLVFNILLYKYAPADTEKHPLLGVEFRRLLKTKTLINGILLMIVTLLTPFNNLKPLIVLSVLYVIVTILPMTYKILKRGYDNYEKYE